MRKKTKKTRRWALRALPLHLPCPTFFRGSRSVRRALPRKSSPLRVPTLRALLCRFPTAATEAPRRETVRLRTPRLKSNAARRRAGRGARWALRLRSQHSRALRRSRCTCSRRHTKTTSNTNHCSAKDSASLPRPMRLCSLPMNWWWLLSTTSTSRRFPMWWARFPMST